MFKEFQLKNGLKVIFVKNNKSPVVSIQMWVRTGSADEPQSLRGISHFIEHLVFKGTESFGVGQIASIVEGSGGELNAYTSFDQTVFYVTISSHFAKTGLKAVGEMMGSPKFDTAEIDNEREVVIEEIRRGMDSPSRQASRLLFESMYPKHPYGKPVIGYDKVIQKVSREQIVRYYKDRYSPANMSLLVVGDFKPAEMKKWIEEQFRAVKKAPTKKIKRPKEAVRKRQKIAISSSSFEQSFLFWSWPVPPIQSQDALALEALAMIVGQGDSSRLVRRLRLEKNIVQGVGASCFFAKDPGFLSFSATFRSEHLNEVQSEFLKEWEETVSTAPSSEDFEKSIINLKSEHYFSLETVDGMARRLGHFEDLYRDLGEIKRYLKAIDKLKPSDLTRVARKYLQPNRLTVSYMAGRDGKTTTAQVRQGLPVVMPKSVVKKTLHSAKPRRFNWEPKATKSELRRAQIPEKVMRTGSPVLIRPAFDTPLFTVRLGLLGGGRMETESQRGLNELAVRTWVGATRKKTEQEVLHLIDSCASSFSAFGGRNTLGLSLTALRAFEEPMLDLFNEQLTEFRITDDIIERERHQILNQIRTRKDNPAQVAMLAAATKLFGDHPMGRDPLGNPETLTQITAQDVENHIRRGFKRSNLAFAVCGHMNVDQMFSRIDSLLAPAERGTRQLGRMNVVYPKETQRVFEESAKEQSNVVLIYPGLEMSDPRRFSIQILEAVLAGQGGRLFIRLRDRASLAYSVAPLRLEGVDGGYFGAYIGCAPGKVPKAIEMLQAEFHELVREPLTQDEIQRAKRYLLGRHDIELQRNSTIASAMLFDELYGQDFAEVFRYRTNLEAVSSEEVQQLAKTIFSKPFVISVVGPKNPWS